MDHCLNCEYGDGSLGFYDVVNSGGQGVPKHTVLHCTGSSVSDDENANIICKTMCTAEPRCQGFEVKVENDQVECCLMAE